MTTDEKYDKLLEGLSAVNKQLMFLTQQVRKLEGVRAQTSIATEVKQSDEFFTVKDYAQLFGYSCTAKEAKSYEYFARDAIRDNPEWVQVIRNKPVKYAKSVLKEVFP